MFYVPDKLTVEIDEELIGLSDPVRRAIYRVLGDSRDGCSVYIHSLTELTLVPKNPTPNKKYAVLKLPQAASDWWQAWSMGCHVRPITFDLYPEWYGNNGSERRPLP